MSGNRIPRSIIAHRLGAGLGPENSAAACAAALRAGFRAFECDVKLSADGVAFLLHDDTLLRTHGCGLRASALDWTRLCRLTQRGGAALPSLRALREVLRGCAEPTWVNLEIKPDGDAGAAQQADWGRRVGALAAALWSDAATPPCLSSFSIPALQGAAEAAAQLPRAWLCERLPQGWRGVAQTLRVEALHLEAGACTPRMVHALRASGLRVRLYTVNDATRLRRWLRLGASGVFTDIVPADPRVC